MGGDSRLFPPTLDGTNYTMGKKYAIWNAIVNGFKFDFDNLTELEKDVNARARNILLAMIDSTAHHQVSSCKTAKEIWDHLTVAHEGTSQVRDTQVGILVNNFELFIQKKGETIREMSGRFNALINALKNMSKDYSTLEKIGSSEMHYLPSGKSRLSPLKRQRTLVLHH